MRFLHQHEAEAVARGEMSPDEATVVMPAVPPLVKGGQDHTDDETAARGAWFVFGLLAGAGVLIFVGAMVMR